MPLQVTNTAQNTIVVMKVEKDSTCPKCRYQKWKTKEKSTKQNFKCIYTRVNFAFFVLQFKWSQSIVHFKQ